MLATASRRPARAGPAKKPTLSMVDEATFAAANVASSTIESVGFFAGPALAGLLLAVASISTVYIFNAATFVWSAFLVLGIRTAKKEPDGEVRPAVAPVAVAKPGFLAEASAGYREILGSRSLRVLVGLYCAQTVVAGASLVFSVSIALNLLGIGRSGYGYLNATLGIGGLVGGFVALV